MQGAGRLQACLQYQVQLAARRASAASASSSGRGVATRTATQPSLLRAVRGLLRDYKQLSKARLSLLVALTASAGFVAGSGEDIDLRGLAWTTAGTFGAAAAANALNQVYEAANDQRMNRTCNRPLPAGRMGRAHALAFAAVAGAAGLWALAEQVRLAHMPDLYAL